MSEITKEHSLLAPGIAHPGMKSPAEAITHITIRESESVAEPVRVRKGHRLVAGLALAAASAGFGIGAHDGARQAVVDTVTAPIDAATDLIDQDLREQNQATENNLPPAGEVNPNDPAAVESNTFGVEDKYRP